MTDTRVTKPFHNRIAIIFDFDDTLAPGTFDTLMESLGYDPGDFVAKNVQPLIEDGWEAILARAHALLEVSKTGDQPLTREYFAKVGRDLDYFEGVPEMFGHLRGTAQEIVPDIEVEFYLLTAGFVEIPKASSIAKEFTEMWGCEFYFDDKDEIMFPKNLITHPEKVRYILGMAKGLGVSGENSPSNVYREVPEDEWHVPLSQVIYVGDGASDMPAFALMNERRGLAIGVYKAETPEDWASRDDMYARRRVQNLAYADYTDGSELMKSLTLAVESICKEIALRKLGKDE